MAGTLLFFTFSLKETETPSIEAVIFVSPALFAVSCASPGRPLSCTIATSSSSDSHVYGKVFADPGTTSAQISSVGDVIWAGSISISSVPVISAGFPSSSR